MDQQVLKWLALDGHAQLRQPDAVGLHHFARPMHLFQHGHLRLVQRPPLVHPALKGPHLPFLVMARILLAQPAKQRFGFQFRRSGQHGFDLGPMLDKRIAARPIVAALLQLARQALQALVLGDRLAAAHVGTGGGLFLGLAFLTFSHHDPHLGVGGRHDWSPSRAQSMTVLPRCLWAFLIVVSG